MSSHKLFYLFSIEIKRTFAIFSKNFAKHKTDLYSQNRYNANIFNFSFADQNTILDTKQRQIRRSWK